MRHKLHILRDEIVFDGRFVRLTKRYFLNSKGREEVWEMVERKTFGRIVGIAAVTPKNEIILIKNYRLPFRKYVIELPAGLADKRGEREIMMARRELLEETGYAAKKFEVLTHGPFYAGLTTDRLVVYLARDAHWVQRQKLGPAEDIEVVKVPLKKLFHFLAHPLRGTEVDLKLFGLIPHLKARGYKIE